MAEIAWDLLGHQGIADLLQEVRPLCLSPEQACRKISKTTPCKVASDRKDTTLCTRRLTCRANHLQISIIAQSVAEPLLVRAWLASFRCCRPARYSGLRHFFCPCTVAFGSVALRASGNLRPLIISAGVLVLESNVAAEFAAARSRSACTLKKNNATLRRS